jgi:hypothetical protein
MSSSFDENVNNLWHHAKTLKSCFDLQRFLANLPDTKVRNDMNQLVENIINDPTWSAILLSNQNHNGKSEVIPTSSDPMGDHAFHRNSNGIPEEIFLAAEERSRLRRLQAKESK